MDKRKLEDLLDKLEIPINILGYKYCVTAVELYLEDNDATFIDIYKNVAKIHNTTSTKVERALRTICEASQEILQKYFNVTYKIISSRLIGLLAREMKR